MALPSSFISDSCICLRKDTRRCTGVWLLDWRLRALTCSVGKRSMVMNQERNSESTQSLPVKLYRTSDRIVLAAPMPGLQPEDLTIEVTSSGRLILQCGSRGTLRDELFYVQAANVREGHE